MTALVQKQLTAGVCVDSLTRFTRQTENMATFGSWRALFLTQRYSYNYIYSKLPFIEQMRHIMHLQFSS